MKRWLTAALSGVLIWLAWPAALAGEEEVKLMTVFLGRFSAYIDLPERAQERFAITLIDENPFGSLLADFYRDRLIAGKPVQVHLVTRVEDIGQTDILFVTLANPQARQEAIDYAQRHSILTISQSKGFAERGGIIQLDFLPQGTRIKVNQGAALRSNIRIAAPLLALAQVITETPR